LAREESRADIEGPLCLFVNLRGGSRIKLDQRSLPIDASSVAISTAGQRFTLDYEKPVEVLNFYFADDWVRDVACFDDLKRLLRRPCSTQTNV